MRSRGHSLVFLGVILLAAALRLPALASRPMHADEAIHADRFGTLLETGDYLYDPADYHGPTLYYVTLPGAWLTGARRYVDLDEVVLRAVPAALGVALVAAHLGARSFLGTAGATGAAALAALSPALVFYSRYYIHETPLVLFSLGALLSGCWYRRRPGATPALLGGVSLGLMVATKETATLVLGSLGGALALTLLVDRWREGTWPDVRSAVRGRDVLLAVLAAVAVGGLLFTSFSRHPSGIVDAARAYALYAERASGASGHVHPWTYYLHLLLHFPSTGTPFWTEGLVVALATFGGLAGFRPRDLPGVDARVLRFLTFYTLLMLVLYSSIPYKTPWCVLGPLHGLILLAGPGAVSLIALARRGPHRILVSVLLTLCVAHLGWQAFSASFRFASDPRNPYVYAHTGTDVFVIVRRLEGLARAHPDGLSVPLQVIGRENLWPLPWYLRRFTRVDWWNGVSETASSAPVIVSTPEMEAALVRRLYDLPPPGQRPLYVSVFDRPVELRPGVVLRAYATQALWEACQRHEADARAPAPRP